MRNELLERILIGVGVGLAIILTRATMSGAPWHYQLLALLVLGCLLGGIQLVLILRRGDQEQPRPDERAKTGRPDAPGREQRRNPFARELTRTWTGLHEPPLGGSTALPGDSKELSADSSREQRLPPDNP